MKLEERPVIDGIMGVFVKFLQMALPEIGISAISLRVYDSEYDNLILFGQTGFKYPEERRPVVPVKGTIAGRLYQEGEKRYITIGEGKYFTSQDLTLAEKEKHVSLLAGSLTYLGRGIGTVQAYTQKNYQECQTEKLDMVMGHLMEISSRFVRSYLEDEFLLEVQEELTGTNPRGGFSHMARVISELFDTTGVVIYYRSDDDHVKLIAGFSEKEIPSHGIGQEFKISKNGEFNLEYLEEVISKRKTMIFQGHDEKLNSIHAIMHFQKTQSIMVAPIVVEDYVQGFIVVNQSDSRPGFTPEEVTLIERIALKASQALSMIRLQKHLSACQASNVTSDVVAEIRHTLRNAIVPIYNYAEQLAADESLSEEAKRKADIVVEEANKLNEQLEIIENLYTDEERIEKNYFNLPGFLEQMIGSWQNRAHGYGCEINLTIHQKERNIYGNQTILIRALENLIINALEAMNTGQTLEIDFKISRKGNSVITLKNPGEINHQDVLPKIFNPRFTTKEEGNGLGLPIAKKDIALHGGELSCEVSEGFTIFRIVLPKQRREN